MVEHKTAPALVEPLTLREQSILELIRLGRPNREIASELGLSPDTVKSYASALFGKLGVSNRYEAAVWPERPTSWWLPGVAPVLFWFRDRQSSPLHLVSRPLGWLVSGAVVVGGTACSNWRDSSATSSAASRCASTSGRHWLKTWSWLHVWSASCQACQAESA